MILINHKTMTGYEQRGFDKLLDALAKLPDPTQGVLEKVQSLPSPEARIAASYAAAHAAEDAVLSDLEDKTTLPLPANPQEVRLAEWEEEPERWDGMS